ncbi:hypothetical protein RintRC_6106 [Richelia intracellularis]|nr:hypothetical protein RintRC_6106 [Richelia intracellularis]
MKMRAFSPKKSGHQQSHLGATLFGRRGVELRQVLEKVEG